MASDSPRARINQFFLSKKRKPLSPAFKHGRTEKDARIGGEGYLSVKGTLENYLSNSQEQNRDAVRRTLDLGTGSSPKKDNKGLSSLAERDLETPEVMGNVQRENLKAHRMLSMLQFKVSKKTCQVQCETQNYNSLRMIFVSVFELCSIATSPSKPKSNDHKRHGSPSFAGDEDKPLKKRHFLTSESHPEGETAFCSEKKTENKQSTRNVKADIPLSIGTVEGSLRKCNRVSKVTAEIAECIRPGSSMVKTIVRETPRSKHGSSTISPGDSFWNEAIQIADGLFTEADNILPEADNEDLNNGSCGDKLREMLSRTVNKSQEMESRASLEFRTKMRYPANEASPLPVKHLDFMFEDKNLDASSPLRFTDNLNTPKGGEQSECCSVNVKSTRTGLLNRDNDSSTSASPTNEIKKNSAGNDGYIEAGTPSSNVPLRDRLDLDNWLPSQVCSIYKSKGISKLYSWQVDCLQVDGVLQKRNLVYCASTRDEHPIVPVIKEHRTLAKLLNCTLGSICSLARLSIKTRKYTLHGHWLQTSTATGRLSSEEPNLQCVEHMVEFRMCKDENGGDADPNNYKINARDFIVPTQDNWLLLTADYSQIELRLMAHLLKMPH
ncbi:DNA polymerase I [Euphorbia peplus]|nr:DNA polymerase I [Euphorbia peplus]